MSRESSMHVALVEAAVAEIRRRHQDLYSLTVYIDLPSAGPDRPAMIGGYLQAQDRIHRISQTKECHIWNLIAAGTVDDWVDMLLAAKHLAAQLAQGDISREEYRVRANYDFGRVVREILKAG